jgi:hypothetical protein
MVQNLRTAGMSGDVMRDRYWEIAKRYTPAFIKVKFKRKKKGKVVLAPAHACLQLEEMLVPKPDSLEALVFYLHECAHFHLRHFDLDEARTPKLAALYTGGAAPTVAQQEYEAEQWTLATLRREGLSVPQSVIEEMRSYVRDCIEADNKKPPRRVRLFAK